MSEVPDYTQAGDVFRQSMEAALAHLDEVNANLRLEQEKAIDLQIAAKDEFNRIQREAHKISEDYIDKHRKEYLAQIRSEVYKDVVKKLILAEIPSDKLKLWLDIPPNILADIWFDIGFEKLGDNHIGHLRYEGKGRAGTLIFYRNDLTLHFPYEFGGEHTIATIEIPTIDNWEKETGLEVAERQTILEFIAGRLVRNQSPNGQYEIQADQIIIK